MSELNVIVEMNGVLILDTGDIITRSLVLVVMMVVVSSIHSIVTFTSLSTVSGSVTVQFIVCKVPSYSSPLGILRVDVGVGTVWTDRS